MFGIIILLLVLLPVSAFFGGFIQGKMGGKYKNLRTPITIALYVLLALITVPLTA